MSEEYDIDSSPESPELLETARVQLRETAEIRKQGFEKLRELLKENKDLNYPDTEEFMEVILRCCHWYPEGAIKLVSDPIVKKTRKLKKSAVDVNIENFFILLVMSW